MKRITLTVLAATILMLTSAQGLAQSLVVRTAEVVGGLDAAQRTAFGTHSGSWLAGIATDRHDAILGFVMDPWTDVPTDAELGTLLQAIDEFTAQLADPGATLEAQGPFDADAPRTAGLGAGTAAIILDGLTDFLINRARIELTALYLDRIRLEFAKERVVTLGSGEHTTVRYRMRDIFPAVDALLRNSDVIFSAQIGPSLQAAFAEDLRHVVERVDQHVVPPSMKTEAYDLAMAAYLAARDVDAGYTPLTVVKRLRRHLAPEDGEDHAAALVVLSDMADVFSDPDADGDRLIDLTMLTSFDPRQWQYLQRLLVDRQPTAYRTLGLADRDAARRVFDAVQAVVRGLEQWRKLATGAAVTVATSTAGAAVDPATWLGNATAPTNTPTPEPRTTAVADQRLIAMAALPRLLDMAAELATLMQPDLDTTPPQLAAARSLAEIPLLYRQENYARIIPRCATAWHDLGLGDLSDQPVLTYAAFAADVAMADSSSQVAELFERAALPPGSARQKGQYGGLYLNAYVGMGFGWESVTDVDGHENHVSAFAPVGLEYAFSGKLSLMAALIDVGVLASKRLDDDDSQVSAESSTSFGQVFAPGLIVAVRPFANPLALCAGVQLAPDLREVIVDDDGTGTAVTTRDAMATRITLAVSVDIPIFRF